MPNLHARPYGVGLAYRYLIHEGVFKHRDSIDLLELSTEDYIVRRRLMNSDPDLTLLKEALAEFPSVAHGISLSIGSVEPLDTNYLEATRKFMEDHQVEIFSEHLAYHRLNRRDLGIFLALPFEEMAVQWIKHNYEAAKKSLGRPFALENVTYYFPVPKSSMREAEFLTRLTEETDCTLLLDVTNVYNNAHNHGYDPYKFLDQLPLDRVSQLHLAGGHFVEGKWEDSHSRPVMSPVWDLYDEVVRRTPAEIVIIERDSRFHPFETVMEDVVKAREIFYKHRPAQPKGDRKNDIFEASENPIADAGSDLPQFEDLRGFQQAIMGRISVPEFRNQYYKDPAKALNSISMSDEWRERARMCDQDQMEKLEMSWDAFQEQERVEKERAEKQEWAAWAEQLNS